jgi:hypothetical protein
VWTRVTVPEGVDYSVEKQPTYQETGDPEERGGHIMSSKRCKGRQHILSPLRRLGRRRLQPHRADEYVNLLAETMDHRCYDLHSCERDAADRE